ncbi:unnamed protein product [Paramecium sonneborni]|uniref:Band 7 domain-containing protein n=1 Tax=Paramecium sonneborni TaxID=65129 RepID=A0A8S1KB95_9CILI|nr:unnamed protein product [Paramecium sonneborni]
MAGEFTGICGACCGISSFILFLMIILSFSSLDYNEVGLDYSSITKTISPKIYSAGIHFLGIGHEFITFPKTVQTVEFSDDKSADRKMIHSRTSDGLEVVLEISFQYTYNLTQLYSLYATYQTKHKPILIRQSIDILSYVATQYSAYDFFMDRQNIGIAMQAALDDLFEKELYCNCEFFQLRSVDLPNDFENAIWSSEVKKQEIVKAQAQKNKTEVELETNKMTALYNREVVLNQAYGEANSTLSNGKAKADAFLTIQEANQQAMKSLKEHLKLNGKGVISYLQNKALRDYEGDDLLIFI